MNGLEKYIKGNLELEKPFVGLPYAWALLARSLIPLADPLTGVVSNISYHDLTKILTVNPAPGRKESGTPSKQTIRNYLKSIERECGEYFKVISKGQKLQVLFPEMPKIFNDVFEYIEVNTDLNCTNLIENIDENMVFDSKVNTELNIEVNIPNVAVKNIFINKNINNNNNNPEKKLIADDFKPDAKTIERALALGFTNANDANEIQNFIAYNKASGSLWADFSPIYLRWLVRSQDLQKQKQVVNKNAPKDTRRVSNVNTSRTNQTKTHKQSIRERIVNAWTDEFAFCDTTSRFEPKEQEFKPWIDSDFMAAIG